jgi:osmoprotectant transport system ATP-binding protein
MRARRRFEGSNSTYRKCAIFGILGGHRCEAQPFNMPTDPTPTSVIEFRDVSYVLPNGQALLSGLNLRVERGETLVFLGRSGSGKTTTLKLINRLLTPASGEVLVNGTPTTKSDVIRLRRSIGYVIQDVGLFPHYTVERNIGIGPKLEGWSAARIHQRVEELLQLVGLEASLAGRYPHQLSGGQRQRVGVARALAADPAILLMDEPFGALDALTRAQLQREFRSLQQRLNKTVVFVTHDLSEALRLGSRIALMDAGRLVTVLPPEQFLRSGVPLAVAYVQAFSDGLEVLANRGDR